MKDGVGVRTRIALSSFRDGWVTLSLKSDIVKKKSRKRERARKREKLLLDDEKERIRVEQGIIRRTERFEER